MILCNFTDSRVYLHTLEQPSIKSVCTDLAKSKLPLDVPVYTFLSACVNCAFVFFFFARTAVRPQPESTVVVTYVRVATTSGECGCCREMVQHIVVHLKLTSTHHTSAVQHIQDSLAS